MAIKAKFTMDGVRKRCDAFLAEIEKRQIEMLQNLGEKCVTHAQNVPTAQGFHDQTGNLRSSIGYMVFKDGVAVHTGYEAVSVPSGTIKVRRTTKRKLKDGTVKTYSYMANVKVGGSGTEGAQAGQNLANQVGQNTKGLALVVTAGMNYAAYVEAKGRDVLASAEILAQRELPRMLDKLARNINAASNGKITARVER